MSNLVLGLASLSAAAVLCGLAVVAYRRGRTGLAALALVAVGFVLRAVAACDLFLHPWDERFHALVAKHLLAHPLRPTLYDPAPLPFDYRYWKANGVWLHKPPLTLWLIAGSFAVFGVNEIALRLPSVLLSTVAVLLTYGIGVRLFDRRVALVAAFFHAVHGNLIQLAAGRAPVDHVDTMLVTWVELGVFLAVVYAQSESRTARGWLLAALGLSAGLAVLTKWLPGLLALPLWLALVWKKERPRAIVGKLLLLGLLTAAVVLPWQLYVHAAFPREAAWEAEYNRRHLFEPLEGLGGPPTFYLTQMPRLFGELVYLPLAWLAVELWRRRKTVEITPLALVGVWLAIPYLAFSLAASKMGGYVMIAAPAVFLLVASFWFRLAAITPETAWARALRAAVLVLLLVLPLRYTVERLKPWTDYDRDPAWARQLRALPARLGAGKVVLFGVEHPIEAMFYTPYAAYPGLPSAATVAMLHRQGYRAVLVAPPGLPAPRIPPGVEVLRVEAPTHPD